MIVGAVAPDQWSVAIETLREAVIARACALGIPSPEKHKRDYPKYMTLLIYEAMSYRATHKVSDQLRRYVLQELKRLSEHLAPPAYVPQDNDMVILEEALVDADLAILQLVEILTKAYPLRYPIETDVYERGGILYIELPEKTE